MSQQVQNTAELLKNLYQSTSKVFTINQNRNMCHVLGVWCHLSHVTCCVSPAPVTFHMSLKATATAINKVLT